MLSARWRETVRAECEFVGECEGNRRVGQGKTVGDSGVSRRHGAEFIESADGAMTNRVVGQWDGAAPLIFRNPAEKQREAQIISKAAS